MRTHEMDLENLPIALPGNVFSNYMCIRLRAKVSVAL